MTQTPLVIHVATADMGLRFLLLNQLQALQAAGYRVHGISADGPYRHEVQVAGVPVSTVPLTRALTPLADLRALAELVRIFRRLRPTIVHTHNPKPGLLGQLAARIAGVPLVVNTIHGFYFHPGSSPRQRRFYVLMERIAARCSDAILSQNREDLATAVAERICRPEAISYLGNGIDVERFDRRALDPAQQQRLRAELGIPPEAMVVGAVGRLVAEKGYHELFAAVRELAPAWPQLHLLVVGPEEPGKADRLGPQVLAGYGLAGRVQLAGLRLDMPELYGLMDVLAHPSHREGFPRAPMEAAAMGLPVVASDIRGCRETVVHGQTGLLVPVKDAVALRTGLDLLLRQPALGRAYGTLGRRLAEREFDERLVFRRVLATYARLGREHGLALPA
jgi:glycosyltransferase involved in cell wall biosynthesis